MKSIGSQYIDNATTATLPEGFRGRPVISGVPVDEKALVQFCPTRAIKASPLRLDLGRCAFCGECALAFPEKILFTSDYKLATNDPERLLISEGENMPITLNPQGVRREIAEIFRGSLKLLRISAGGDNSTEMELSACTNANFDMERYGIEFVSFPHHADGIVITGPLSGNMAESLQKYYDAIPDPKLIILAGTDAISGGLFAGSSSLNRSFLKKYPVDLYVPGNPPHPLTFINGVLELIKRRK